ncbi:MAG: 30S ribosomal protein S18 [Melioribacteraceae bacterium]|nr:30S ribosomal protein S18 [Melioribacteraceae bacterium]
MKSKKVRRVIDEFIDYKDVKKLQKFVTDQGKIIPRRITGLSAKQHRELIRAIKRARQIAVMPFVSEALK